MLFRLRSGDRVRLRAGQESFHFGDFFAYSKICTHVGCPVSLYEQQTGRILCPCHQSQFDVNDGARPGVRAGHPAVAPTADHGGR